MDLPPEFWSCDWGTTSFRLRLVNTTTLEIQAERKSDGGARALYDRAVASGKRDATERAELFASALRDHLTGFRPGPRQPCPMVISGMASSTIGWKELPYAALPFHLDGRDARIERLAWQSPESVSETLLLSGIASANDMMRGEETESIGIMSLQELADAQSEAWLILPGTHSKHLRVQNGAVIDFHTCMTGELFEVLARHSILKASVAIDAVSKADWNQGREPFREGVSWVRQRGLPRSLFRTRTRAVLDQRPHEENAWFLSGLLIGAEVSEINWKDANVIIGGAGALPILYEAALATLSDGSADILRLNEQQASAASVAGQKVILQRFCEQ